MSSASIVSSAPVKSPEALAPDEILRVVEDELASTQFVDVHTHLFMPSLGAIGLWGIDELITYHYLEAEFFRSSDTTPDRYWEWSKPQQADAIWRALFVENPPVSEATRGVVAVLQAFGLPTSGSDLTEARAFFAAQEPKAHIGRVFELAGISEVVMTNDPLDPDEAPLWQRGAEPHRQFHAVLRLDRILNKWAAHWSVLAQQGYAVNESATGKSASEVRRFLADWGARMNPAYMAVSLPDTFVYPENSIRGRLLEEAVLPSCRDFGIPLSVMIGVRYQVNPAIRLAGDAVGQADLSAVERLCAGHSSNRFLISVLSRENQHELCVYARKFSNLMPFGCWWFLNNPSIVEEITRERLEMLGTTFIPQHSDARVLEQVIYKWRNTRRTLAPILANMYRLLSDDGRPVTRAEIHHDVTRLFRANFERFTGIGKGRMSVTALPGDSLSEVLSVTASVVDECTNGADDGAARDSLASRLNGHSRDGVTFHAGSYARVGESRFLTIDQRGAPLLLQFGGSPSPFGLSKPIFQHGRNGAAAFVYPFGSSDYTNIEAFAERIDRAFLPRPQRAEPAIAAGNRHPEISLPAVFEAFREILSEQDVNVASTAQLSATREMTTDDEIARRDGSNPVAPGHTRVSIRHLYHAGLWAAIRSGYRAGYNAEADHFIVSGANEREIAKSVEWVKEAIRHASGYTKFTTDTSRVFDLRADARHPSPWSSAEIGDLFEKRLTPEERSWILAEFSHPFHCGGEAYEFDAPDIQRLAVKFAPSLKLNEELYDAIARAKTNAPFDFEPSLDEAETLTTAKELIFYMHWLRQRGRPAQLVPPNLGFKKRQAYPETRASLEKYASHKMWPELLPRVAGEFKDQPIAELKDRVRELAEVARFFDGTLSIHSGSGKQAEVLQSIGSATRGRLNYKISGELQLQLFDVLYESPAGSPERQLYDRMVDACERAAGAGAFGEESALAADYRAAGRGSYLGDAAKGRVDGNLFLVFWLGNMVGSRDVDGRFFKEALDRLPRATIEDTQRRNTRYVKWLAANLWVK